MLRLVDDRHSAAAQALLRPQNDLEDQHAEYDGSRSARTLAAAGTKMLRLADDRHSDAVQVRTSRACLRLHSVEDCCAICDGIDHAAGGCHEQLLCLTNDQYSYAIAPLIEMSCGLPHGTCRMIPFMDVDQTSDDANYVRESLILCSQEGWRVDGVGM
eukprot:COSAG06_NODE_13006_length_1303_cov_1.364618_3_plen_157_part_01